MTREKQATKKASRPSAATPQRYAKPLPPAARRALLESLPLIQLPPGETAVDLVRAVRGGDE